MQSQVSPVTCIACDRAGVSVLSCWCGANLAQVGTGWHLPGGIWLLGIVQWLLPYHTGILEATPCAGSPA